MRSRQSCPDLGAGWGRSGAVRGNTPALRGVSFLFRQIPSGFSRPPTTQGRADRSRSKRLVSATAGNAGRFVLGHSWVGAAGRVRVLHGSGPSIHRPWPGLPWGLAAPQGFAPPALHQGQWWGRYGQEGAAGEPGGSRDPFPTHTLKLRRNKSFESLCPPVIDFPDSDTVDPVFPVYVKASNKSLTSKVLAKV